MLNCSATVLAKRCNSLATAQMVMQDVQSSTLKRTRFSKYRANAYRHVSVAQFLYTTSTHACADTRRLLYANHANHAIHSHYQGEGPDRIGDAHDNDHDFRCDEVQDNIDASNKPKHHTIQQHCPTCSCGDTNSNGSGTPVSTPMTMTSTTSADTAGSTSSRQHCNPLPPPLPEPRYSVHKRILPPHLIALSSPRGRHLLLETLASTPDSPYWSLSEHFQNQSEPAYCGVTTLVMVLNSMSIDPQIRWKGGWRYYGSEDVLLSKCTECLAPERIRRIGITMEEFKQLAHCQGLRHVSMKRPIATTETGPSPTAKHCADNAANATIHDFRNDLKQMTMASSTTSNSTFVMNPNTTRNSSTKQRPRVSVGVANQTTSTMPMPRKTTITTRVIVTSFSRAALGQTGDGHFSPIGAYHEPSDSVLIMDVARFKYPPYWVPVQDLFQAMIPIDPASHMSRGWFTLINATTITNIDPPCNDNDDDSPHYHHHQNEHRRPAKLVPLAGQGDICPVGKIKAQFCKINRFTTAGQGDGYGMTQE